MSKNLDPKPYVDMFTGERYTVEEAEHLEIPLMPREPYDEYAPEYLRSFER